MCYTVLKFRHCVHRFQNDNPFVMLFKWVILVPWLMQDGDCVANITSPFFRVVPAVTCTAKSDGTCSCGLSCTMHVPRKYCGLHTQAAVLPADQYQQIHMDWETVSTLGLLPQTHRVPLCSCPQLQPVGCNYCQLMCWIMIYFKKLIRKKWCNIFSKVFYYMTNNIQCSLNLTYSFPPSLGKALTSGHQLNTFLF